jgi:hypothetical protein
MKDQAALTTAIGRWLRDDAPAGAPAGLLSSVVEGTAGLRQDRVLGLPAALPLLGLRNRRWLLIVAGLVVALVAAALIGASWRTPPNDQGVLVIDAGGEVHLLDVATGAIRAVDWPLANVPRSMSPPPCPAFSADAAAFAYSATDEFGGVIRLVVHFVDGRSLVVDEIDYDPEAMLPGGWDPVWSPTGMRLAHRHLIEDPLGGNYASGVWIHDLPSDSSVELPAIDGGDLSWSPDGRYLTAATFRGSIRVLDVDTGEVTVLATPQTSAYAPAAWSPDGRRMAFADAGPGRFFDVFVIEVDGTGRTNITNNQEISSSEPSWSADGRWLLYVSGLGTNLTLHDLRSGERLDVGSDRQTVWSPGGAAFAAIDGSRVVITEASDLATRDAGAGEGNEEVCAWLPTPGRR